MTNPVTPTTTTLPAAKQVRDLLEVLLGRDVIVAPGTPTSSGPLSIEALYVDDRLRMQALAVTGLPFAAYAGAAIGLMPPAAAAAAVHDGVLGEIIQENVTEVFNVMAALVNRDGEPHLRMYTTYPPEVAAPPDVLALSGSLGRRIDLDVDISGYGRGGLGIVLT